MNLLNPAHILYRYLMSLAVLLVSFAALTARAEAMVSPDQLITNLFNEVNARMQKDQTKIAADKSHLVVIGEEVLVPYVSFETMAKQILGKNWRKISPDQQHRYTVAFKERVSSSIVAQYDPSKQYALQITGSRTNDKGDRAMVSSDVTDKSSGQKYQISYKLFTDKKVNRWQVYDVAVDGVSVLQSFKSASAEDFKRNGIEYMIAQMERTPDASANTTSAKP